VDNIKIIIKELGHEDEDWIHMTQDGACGGLL
jgi:hypothetical protein